MKMKTVDVKSRHSDKKNNKEDRKFRVGDDV